MGFFFYNFLNVHCEWLTQDLMLYTMLEWLGSMPPRIADSRLLLMHSLETVLMSQEVGFLLPMWEMWIEGSSFAFAILLRSGGPGDTHGSSLTKTQLLGQARDWTSKQEFLSLFLFIAPSFQLSDFQINKCFKNTSQCLYFCFLILKYSC